MKICDYFEQKKFVVSCEIFPPKPTYPLETVFETLTDLKELKPDFISVTYGAGGGNAARSIEIAARIKNDFKIETLAHLTCVGSSHKEIEALVDQLAENGIENILALRGDPPQGETEFTPAANGYSHASDLIEEINKRGQFCIAAAAYPEGHPECAAIAKDIQNLKFKVDRGVDFLVTQLFFDNDKYYAFEEKIRKNGIICPIHIGIMPVLNAAQVKRITSLCSAAIPAGLQKLMDRYGNCAADMEKAGIEYACKQIDDLMAHRVNGIHLYTMNKAAQTKTILQHTGLR
ncbi:MAG: methylenetetrahydrofolate reductase [NAD(P)H] [Negativicutes bacterium]